MSTPEWSHTVDVSDIPADAPYVTEISPNEEQMAALCYRLKLMAMDACTAKISITAHAGGRFYVQGILHAEIVQECVTTLEPIRNTIEDSFDAWYANGDEVISFAKEKQRKKKHEEHEMLSEEEDPDQIIDDKIDIGELAAQYLSLSIDPYPHKDGVEPVGDDNPQKQSPMKNPFAALKEWKDRQR